MRPRRIFPLIEMPLQDISARSGRNQPDRAQAAQYGGNARAQKRSASAVDTVQMSCDPLASNGSNHFTQHQISPFNMESLG